MGTRDRLTLNIVIRDHVREVSAPRTATLENSWCFLIATAPRGAVLIALLAVLADDPIQDCAIRGCLFEKCWK